MKHVQGRITFIVLCLVGCFLTAQTARAQFGVQCSYQALSGDYVNLTYSDYYMQLFNIYQLLKGEKSAFLRRLNEQSAAALIQTCPSFHQRLMKGEMPFHQGKSLTEQAIELLGRRSNPDVMRQLKEANPAFRRWASRFSP